jgi:hypothetical protein
LTIASAAMWFGPAAVLASPPVRHPYPPIADFAAPMCGESNGLIDFTQTIDRAHETIHFDPNGNVRDAVQGDQTYILTSEDTGKRVTINGSGPGYFTFYANGDVTLDLQGHTLWLNVPDGGIFLYDGLVEWDLETGRPGTTHGHVTDVCALLT